MVSSIACLVALASLSVTSVVSQSAYWPSELDRFIATSSLRNPEASGPLFAQKQGKGQSTPPYLLQDRTGWAHEEVKLYYFPNAILLAETIRPDGKYIEKDPPKGAGDKTAASGETKGDAEAGSGTPATKQPTTLAEALGYHIDALNAVVVAQRELENAEQGLVAARENEIETEKQFVREAKRLELALEAKVKAQSALTAAKDEVTSVKGRIQASETAIAAKQTSIDECKEEIKTLEAVVNPSDEQKAKLAARRAELPKLESDLDKERSKLTQARADLVAAESKETSAKALFDKSDLEHREQEVVKKGAESTYNSAKTATSSAQTRITSAKTGLNTARSNVSTYSQLLRNMRVVEQTRVKDRLETFAQERNDAKVWKADYVQKSIASVGRVEMYVYPGSSTIYLLGLPEDVRVVKEMIADFDTPMPQARVTFWEVEVNLQGNKARNALASGAAQFEKPIEIARGQMSRVGMHFRAALSDRVHEVQKETESSHPSLTDALDGHRLARCFFYEPEAAMMLGLNMNEVTKHPSYYYFTRWTLPDPAATTTLGESVLVYLLGSRTNRDKVIKNFRDKVEKDKFINPGNGPGYKWSPEEFIEEISAGNGSVVGPGMSPYQLEVTRALMRTALDRSIQASPDLVSLYRRFKKRFPIENQTFLMARQAPGGDGRPKHWDETLYKSYKEPEVLGIRQQKIEDKGVFESMTFLYPALLWLKEAFGLTIQVLEDMAEDVSQEDDDLRSAIESQSEPQTAESAKKYAVAMARISQATVGRLRRAYPRSESNARIAAADEMLKRIMIGLEEELQAKFVNPALDEMRRSLQKNSITVGRVDKQSIIATNRYASMMEGTASAELDVSGKEDVLQASLNLADVITSIKKGDLDKIGDTLRGTQSEEDSVFYAVVSGSRYKITPIFDPTGQALRFQFDHVKNTTVLDPDGTKPALPRVDSHAASMMVQVSNLEIRRLTTFEVNTKLGAPERKSGGIPLLNLIYPLSELPIIGWFSRSAGKEAVSQRSMVYAQNAMYPTIGDLTRLMSAGIGVPPTGGTNGK
jgi:hypothetical protein